MRLNQIEKIIDETLEEVDKKGEVKLLVSYRCGEVGWFEMGILKNFCAMLKEKIKKYNKKNKK